MSEGTELVAIGSYRRSEEAHVVRLKLEQHGLLVFVQDENCAITLPPRPAGGAKVLVPADQVVAATKILDDLGNQQP